jgi:hypothetical protein
MKIHWKEVNEFKSEVYADGYYAGDVICDITKKWTMIPNFSYDMSMSGNVHKKYDSFYKCGKVLVDLYNRTFFLQEYSFFEEREVGDTDEYDMKGLFGNMKP